jgi:hypothetical protein
VTLILQIAAGWFALSFILGTAYTVYWCAVDAIDRDDEEHARGPWG